MNKKVIARCVGGVVAGFLLVGAMSPAAVADAKPKPPKPKKGESQALVQSTANTGVSVGGLLDIGASNQVNGTDADSSVKVNGPAGISTSVKNETNVGIDVLTDLAATVSGVVKL